MRLTIDDMVAELKRRLESEKSTHKKVLLKQALEALSRL